MWLCKKLTVEFMEHAEVYFCPRRAIPAEPDSENKYTWVGMKTWRVTNPILKQALPEGSALEKINDIVLKETLEFQEIQKIMDELEPPYSFTFQVTIPSQNALRLLGTIKKSHNGIGEVKVRKNQFDSFENF